MSQQASESDLGIDLDTVRAFYAGHQDTKSKLIAALARVALYWKARAEEQQTNEENSPA